MDQQCWGCGRGLWRNPGSLLQYESHPKVTWSKGNFLLGSSTDPVVKLPHFLKGSFDPSKDTLGASVEVANRMEGCFNGNKRGRV